LPAGEIYVPLSVDFPDNPKVRALARYGREARAARDLYVQMLLYCKRTRSDGFVPLEQVGLLVYPDPERVGKRDAGRLADAELIIAVTNGYRVAGWLERNASRADIVRKSQAKSRGARLANHRRWHEETESPEPGCEWCQKSDQTTDQNADQTRDKSSDQSPDTERVGAAKRSDSKETESETESEEETKNGNPLGQQKPAGRKIEPGSDDDPDFCAFWDVYPRRVAKGQARKAWKTAIIKRGVDPKIIIVGAECYRDDPLRRSRSIEYTAHPGTWLNGERWLELHAGGDGDEPQSPYSSSPWDN
jgi:hypothetical protein